MTLKQYIFSMTAGTIGVALGWIIAATSIDPVRAPFYGFALFYLSAFATLVGALSLAGIFVRVSILRKRTLIAKQVAVALRQSILFSTLVISALILQSINVLTWWNSALLVGILTVFEFFIISLRRKI